MDMKSPAKLGARNRTVPLLILGAMGAILFICASALFFYRNTERLMASHNSEEHSQEVLNLLQLTAQRLERLDYLSRLHLAARNKDDLNTLQATAVLLNTGLGQLESLLWDDAQRNRAHTVHACANELTRQLDVLPSSPESTAVDSMSLTGKVLECRDIVSRMQVQETVLLKQRTGQAQQSAYRSLIAGGVFLIVSLAMVLSLFGFLIRDARKRIEVEGQIFDTNERLNFTVQTLEDRAAEAKLLNSIREELQLCTTPEEAHRTTVRYIAQVLPSAKVALLIVNGSRQMLEIAAASDDETRVLDGFPLNACCGLRVGRSRRRKSGDSEIDCRHFLGAPPQSYLCVPLAAHGDTLGVLYIGYPEPEGSERLDRYLGCIEQLAEMSSVWTAGLSLRERLEEQSIRDGLTNLFNRRFMEIALERELHVAVRRKSELSLLMLDIDHFKHFNDTFGHDAGDQILRGIAEVVRRTVRQEDIACRYGGEELLVILPGTEMEAARQRADEIRIRVSGMRLDIHAEGNKNVTVSIGVSTFPQSGQTMDDLVRAADRALYSAKDSGRNRVTVAESAVVQMLLRESFREN